MPRANRYFVPGQVYHLTHRCHNRDFLLKFARDRDAYRTKLRQALVETEVSLLDYCLTSNHVHLMACAEVPDQISRLMQKVAGGTAQNYNRRKERCGAFWEDRYHATMVEAGGHFMRCLGYIALQMVRCGVVTHPREWNWCGYQELAGLRERYRLIDTERILEIFGGVSLVDFRRHYEALIQDRIAREEFQREAQWTQSIAVGSEAFVRGIADRIEGRQQLEIASSGEAWIVQEVPVPHA